MVGVVDEDVAGTHRREHVGLLVAIARAGPESGVRDRRPGVLAQVGVALDPGELPQIAEVEHALDVVDLHLVDPEPVDQAAAQGRVHAGPHFEPDHFAKAPAAQFVLHGLEQVVGFV